MLQPDSFTTNADLRLLVLENNPRLRPLPWGLFDNNQRLDHLRIGNNNNWTTISTRQVRFCHFALVFFAFWPFCLFQPGQTNQAHPVLTGYYPVFVRGNTPSLYPQLPRVVRLHCTRNYPACRLVIGCHRFLASDWSAWGSCCYNAP